MLAAAAGWPWDSASLGDRVGKAGKGSAPGVGFVGPGVPAALLLHLRAVEAFPAARGEGKLLRATGGF